MRDNDKRRERLIVDRLSTSFYTRAGEVQAVREVSFALKDREIIGIVGESGSGKTVTCLSVIQLLGEPGKIKSGQVFLNGQELTSLKKREMRKIRGAEIAMIFQDPMTSLNPLYTIGNQIMESILEHQKVSKAEAKHKAIEMLEKVGIPDAENRFDSYPFEFSGGMRQRVMIAIALCCEPSVLIADEPTTALDVTIQAQILDLLKNLSQEMNMSTILITHDLACVASLCERVIVMYGGTIVESGSDLDIFYNPHHPYTMGLLKSVPDVSDGSKQRLVPIPGTPPDMLNLQAGCPFYPRCSYAMRICAEQEPYSKTVKPGHEVACWLAYEGVPEPETYLEFKKGINSL